MKTIQRITLFLLVLGLSVTMQAQTNLALTAQSAHSGGGTTGTPDYSAANYNDGLIITCGSGTPWGWVSTNGWIEYTWTSTQTIAKVVFYKEYRPMTSCTIEAWNGTSYTTVMNYSGGTACEDSVSFSTPVTTTKLRFNNIAGSNPNHREIQVYGVPCSTEVLKDPVNVTVCEERNTLFTIKAQDVVNYQWQLDNGSGSFANINNGASFAGATTDSLNVLSTPLTLHGSKYRCLVSRSVCIDTSASAVLEVDGIVRLDAMKVKDTTCINSVKDLVIKHTGTIQNYRWQIFIIGQGYIDVPIAPPYIHSGHVLSINGVPDTLDGSRFRCIVEGVCDTATTNESQLTVAPVPGVAVPPRDTVVAAFTTVVFNVEATSAGAMYRWQVATPNGSFVNINNGGIYQGVNTSKLTVKGVIFAQSNFKFRCIISSILDCGVPGDTSEFAILTVERPASIENINAVAKVVLYPNPANSSDIYLSTDISLVGRDTEYKVIDKTGRVVATGNVTSSNTKIDVSKLAADIYLVQITNNGMVIAHSKFTRL